MKLCDEAAGIAAIKHSRCRVVTAAIDRMTFIHPVHVGELLLRRRNWLGEREEIVAGRGGGDPPQ